LSFQGHQRSVGRGNCPLGIAQGVAGVPAGFFLAIKLAGKPLDPRAQRLEVVLFRGGKRSACPQAERNEQDDSIQSLAFP
jgi:hypothetical protein